MRHDEPIYGLNSSLSVVQSCAEDLAPLVGSDTDSSIDESPGALRYFAFDVEPVSSDLEWPARPYPHPRRPQCMCDVKAHRHHSTQMCIRDSC